MMAQLVVVTMKGGLRQVFSHHVEAYYHKGTQCFVIPSFDDQSIHNMGQFDGVYNDRFIAYTSKEASGDACGEYHMFKQ